MQLWPRGVGGRRRFSRGGNGCFGLLIKVGLRLEGGWPGSLKGYSEDALARRTFQSMEDAHIESVRVYGKGWREGERPDLKVVHMFHEAAEGIERRTRS